MSAAKSLSVARRVPTPWFGAALVIGAALFLRYKMVPSAESIANFRLIFGTPQGNWKAIPHSAQALFLYRHEKSALLIRGASNDIEADINPTPDLDRDGLARYMLDVTDENLKEWQGEMMDTVDAKGTTFRLIRRWCPYKRVISAVAVRGNTTILVTMSGDEKNRDAVERAIPEFKSYLATLGLERRFYN